MKQEKRAQGRPPRGENEVGSHKIVEGMRNALRTTRTVNVTRKDVASFAGVTPALVTYYFPERNGLIEAAALPVVQALVGEVAACFETFEPARQQLSRAVLVLLEAFTRDGSIIQLFSQYQSSQPETTVPDLLRDLDTCLVSFFERWLGENENALYDAKFLQRALIGICKSIGDDEAASQTQGLPHTSEQKMRARMICCMLVGPIPMVAAREALLCSFDI